MCFFWVESLNPSILQRKQETVARMPVFVFLVSALSSHMPLSFFCFLTSKQFKACWKTCHYMNIESQNKVHVLPRNSLKICKME